MSTASKIADYCRISIQNEPKWSYRQYRPMKLGVPPDAYQDADCSSHSIQAYWYGGAPDPGHAGYDGSGWTGTLINNPRCSAPYEIGDLGIYGTSTSNTTHVVTCFEPGSASSARWCSHGSNAGPYSVLLGYRTDLVAVVRPGLGSGGGGSQEVYVPPWYWDFARWYLTTSREEIERPPAAPEKIPDWGWDFIKEDERIAHDRGMTEGQRDWITWYLDGKTGERPNVPEKIPEFWWKDAEYVDKQRRIGDES